MTISIDKLKVNTKWEKIQFDKLCKIITTRIDDPNEAETDYYVGLEHLDSEQLKIRRYGSPKEVKSSKFEFRSGQILFGRRRAYQRKLAVTDVDGICSTDIFVLEPKLDEIVPNYLPLFMQSEKFFERVLELSDGSLSPRIKWKHLAKEEFSIPSKDFQKIVVEIMASLDSCIENSFLLRDSADEFKTSMLNRFFSNQSEEENSKKNKLNFQKFSDICRVVDGSGFPTKYQKVVSTGIPFLKVGDLNHLENKKYIVKNDFFINDEIVEKIKARIYPPGTIIFPKIGAAIFLNKRRILTEPSSFDNNIMGLIENDDIENEFLFYVMQHIKLDKYAMKGVVPNVTKTQVESFKISVPSRPEQKTIVKTLKNLDNQISDIQTYLSYLLELRKSVLNNLTINSTLQEKEISIV